jgi:hypothetical protein
MPSKLMMIFVGVDVVFGLCGGLIMGFSLISEGTMRASPTLDNVAGNLLLDQCPLTGTIHSSCKEMGYGWILWQWRDPWWLTSFAAGIVNATFVFITFLLSLPALFLPMNRGWLRAQGWMVVFCALFTLGLGLSVWVNTLQTRRNLGRIWGDQTPQIQSLLQQKVSGSLPD